LSSAPKKKIAFTEELPEKGRRLFASPGQRTAVLCLILVVATLGLYNPVSGFPFLTFDDQRYVTENWHVQAGLRWETVQWAFTTYDAANWHPLTWLSHALDWQWFGKNPAGHHYVNVLLHAADVVLLFLMLQAATGCAWRSWMVAALFAWHPINAESVVWIAERKNVLSMLFFLLALWAYGGYVRKPGLARYAMVALLFACGLMAKPQVITFPFVLLLWDYWPLERFSGGRNETSKSAQPVLRLLLEKVPLLLMSAASAIVTIKAQAAGGAVRSTLEYSLSERIQNALVAYAKYVLEAFCPARLAPFYPHPGSSLTGLQVLGAALLLGMITAWVVLAPRRRYLFTGWFWFLGTLVPMIGLVTVGAIAMADRYAYLPFIGLFIMVTWGATDAAQLVLLAVVTHRQIAYWKDNVSLWTHTLNVTGPNFVAEDSLGVALAQENRIEDAVPHFQKAVEIAPQDPIGNFNLAAYAQQKGDLQNAVQRYQAMLQMNSDARLRSDAYNNLGSVYRALGDYAHARENYRASLELVPNNPAVLVQMGVLAQKTRDFDEAIADYSRAMAIQPTDVGYLLQAQAFKQSGRAAEAEAARKQAESLSRDLAHAQQEADSLLAR
jgi:tetratricopeptide (TPR) repeat protein